MKNILTFILLLFTMQASSQEFNKKLTDESGNVLSLINRCTREGLFSYPEMKERYDLEYPGYTPDSNTIEALKPMIKDIHVTIVLGTWCGDSKLQVPHFYKVMDALKVSEKDISIIAVDRSKHAENGLLDGLNILRVPTFIITDKKKELGRIVEFPEETLEKDLLSILKK